MPWYRVRFIPGFGTRAANRATKSTGSNATFIGKHHVYCARFHLLETERQGTLYLTALQCSPRRFLSHHIVWIGLPRLAKRNHTDACDDNVPVHATTPDTVELHPLYARPTFVSCPIGHPSCLASPTTRRGWAASLHQRQVCQERRARIGPLASLGHCGLVK